MSFSESILQSWRSQLLFPVTEEEAATASRTCIKKKTNKKNSKKTPTINFSTFSSQTLFEIPSIFCWLSSSHSSVCLGDILQSFPKGRHSTPIGTQRPLGPALVSHLANGSSRDAVVSWCLPHGWLNAVRRCSGSMVLPSSPEHGSHVR